MDPLGTVSTVLSLVKTLTELQKGAKNREAGGILRELNQNIVQLQFGYSKLVDENRRLKQQVKDFANLEEIRKDLEWVPDGGFWVRKSEKANDTFIPYCPTCWGSESKLVPMAGYGAPGAFKCALHDSVHHTKQYEEWRSRQRPARPKIIGRFHS